MSTFIDNNLTIAVLAPLALAVLALILAGYLFTVIRRLRRDQKVVMGAGGERDLVAHANAVQLNVEELSRDITHLTAELQRTGKRLDDCLTFRSVMRYDAYNDLSGMQSTSVALLDAQFSGIIISSIQSRDHARIYVKEVRHGESREQLSPEEIQVLKEAMGLKSHKLSRVAGGGDDD
ncbi:MAG: DUF4446 family protein [Thermoleophilia bacterium]